MGVIQKIYLFIMDMAQTILLAASVFLVIYLFFFRPYQVNGHSMDPTFSDQEYVFTDIITKRFTQFQPGDVVVFKAPIDTSKDFIKRIIGIPGDKIVLKNGDVYRNGKKIDQSYLPEDVRTYGGAFLHEGEEVIVPQDEYLVMGDNRGNSSDSREWGFVPTDDMIGKSLFVYWPVNHARVIRNTYQ